jgi:hypothetical protein
MLVWMIITAVVLPVILILVAPLTFTLFVRKDETLHFTAGVSWFCGGVTLMVANKSGTLLLGPLTLKKISFERKQFTKKKRTGSKKLFRATKVFASRRYLDIKILSTLYKAVKQILAALSLKLEGEASFGFEDPALTGLTCGFMAAAGLAGQHPGLKLFPNFQEADFAGFLSVRGRFTVGKVLFVLIQFLLSRPVRRLWWPRLRRKGVNKEWRKSTLSTT